MEPVEGGLNSQQVSLMRPVYIEKCILVLKLVVLIARVVLIITKLYITMYKNICIKRLQGIKDNT